jgi:glycine cleavage system regulatory protein
LFAAVVTISISVAALDAIEATLPPGESDSDVIIRVARG